jgi:ketopantoate hydroxymethyltransferase
VHDDSVAAIQRFCAEVRSGEFPADGETY